MSVIDGTTQHYTGAASELFAASRFTARGHSVFFPIFTQSKADFIADVEGTLMRIQVKTGTVLNGGYLQVRLGGCGRPTYGVGSVDLLAIVHRERLWVIPFTEDIRNKTSLCFQPEKTSRKLRNDFSQYEWKE